MRGTYGQCRRSGQQPRRRFSFRNPFNDDFRQEGGNDRNQAVDRNDQCAEQEKFRAALPCRADAVCQVLQDRILFVLVHVPVLLFIRLYAAVIFYGFLAL